MPPPFVPSGLFGPEVNIQPPEPQSNDVCVQGIERYGLSLALLIFSKCFRGLPDPNVRARVIDELGVMSQQFDYQEACAAVIEYGRRIEELQQIYNENPNLGALFYPLGHIMCRVAADRDKIAQIREQPRMVTVLQQVDKAFLRILEGLIFMFEQNGELLVSFVHKLFKHGQIPQYALRRGIAACNFHKQPRPQPRYGNLAAMRPEIILQKVAPLEDSYKFKEEILKRLREVVASDEFRGFSEETFRVELFGSGVNGFETKDSDVDCTIINGNGTTDTNSTGGFNHREKCQILKKLLPVYGFESIQIIEARVPLMKVKAPFGNFLNNGKPGVSVDITFNNILGFENSKLLRTYASCPVCRQLGMFVKFWAKRRNIIDAQNGLLSSYVYMLMVIFFLQCRQPILPSLQAKVPKSMHKRENFINLCHNITFDKEWKGEKVGMDKKLTKLICEFFHFYAEEFNFYTEVVSVRTGKSLPKLKYLQYFKKEMDEHGTRKWNCPLILNEATSDGLCYASRHINLLVEDPFEKGQIKCPTYLGQERLCYEFQRATMILSESSSMSNEDPLLRLFDAKTYDDCVEPSDESLKMDTFQDNYLVQHFFGESAKFPSPTRSPIAAQKSPQVFGLSIGRGAMSPQESPVRARNMALSADVATIENKLESTAGTPRQHARGSPTAREVDDEEVRAQMDKLNAQLRILKEKDAPALDKGFPNGKDANAGGMRPKLLKQKQRQEEAAGAGDATIYSPGSVTPIAMGSLGSRELETQSNLSGSQPSRAEEIDHGEELPQGDDNLSLPTDNGELAESNFRLLPDLEGLDEELDEQSDMHRSATLAASEATFGRSGNVAQSEATFGEGGFNDGCFTDEGFDRGVSAGFDGHISNGLDKDGKRWMGRRGGLNQDSNGNFDGRPPIPYGVDAGWGEEEWDAQQLAQWNAWQQAAHWGQWTAAGERYTMGLSTAEVTGAASSGGPPGLMGGPPGLLPGAGPPGSMSGSSAEGENTTVLPSPMREPSGFEVRQNSTDQQQQFTLESQAVSSSSSYNGGMRFDGDGLPIMNGSETGSNGSKNQSANEEKQNGDTSQHQSNGASGSQYQSYVHSQYQQNGDQYPSSGGENGHQNRQTSGKGTTPEKDHRSPQGSPQRSPQGSPQDDARESPLESPQDSPRDSPRTDERKGAKKGRKKNRKGKGKEPKAVEGVHQNEPPLTWDDCDIWVSDRGNRGKGFNNKSSSSTPPTHSKYSKGGDYHAKGGAGDYNNTNGADCHRKNGEYNAENGERSGGDHNSRGFRIQNGERNNLRSQNGQDFPSQNRFENGQRRDRDAGNATSSSHNGPNGSPTISGIHSHLLPLTSHPSASSTCGGTRDSAYGKGDNGYGKASPNASPPLRNKSSYGGGKDTRQYSNGYATGSPSCSGKNRDRVSDLDHDNQRGGPDRDSYRGGPDRDSYRGGTDRDSYRRGPDRDSYRGGPDRDSYRGGTDRDSYRPERDNRDSNSILWWRSDPAPTILQRGVDGSERRNWRASPEIAPSRFPVPMSRTHTEDDATSYRDTNVVLRSLNSTPALTTPTLIKSPPLNSVGDGNTPPLADVYSAPDPSRHYQ